jgi:hypothetical protein
MTVLNQPLVDQELVGDTHLSCNRAGSVDGAVLLYHHNLLQDVLVQVRLDPFLVLQPTLGYEIDQNCSCLSIVVNALALELLDAQQYHLCGEKIICG